MAVRTKNAGVARQIQAFSDLMAHLTNNWDEDGPCKILQTAMDFGYEYGAVKGHRSFLAHITEKENKKSRGFVTIYFRDGIGKVCEIIRHPLVRA